MTATNVEQDDGFVLRAYRVALDPTPRQLEDLARHAGAARWAYNLALAAKIAAREVWLSRVAALVEAGVEEQAARKQVRVRTPGAVVLDKARVRVRGTDRAGRPVPADWPAARRVLVDDGLDDDVAQAVLERWAARVDDPAAGIQPWAPEVPNALVQRGVKDADRAWANWLDGLARRRAGRPPGFPRFKRRGRGTDSFYLTNVEARLVQGSNRRVRLGGILGEVRTHQSLRRVHKALTGRSGVVQAVTVSRGGHLWYASILVREQLPARRPTRAQRAAGTVGVDLGVRTFAALSTGELIPNPRVKATHERVVTKAARAYARTQPGSGRRERARRRLARLRHLEAERRRTHAHALTKRLATSWSTVAVEDLNVAGMTRSARGTLDEPGRNVRAKAGLNRVVLDVAPGEIRRQLTYKTTWYGSRLVVIDRWAPSSKTCSACGIVKPKLALAERTYRCEHCGLTLDRDINAAIVIAHLATGTAPRADLARPGESTVAPSTGETQNARRAGISLPGPRPGKQPAMKREDRPSPPGPRRPPRSSNAAAVHTPA